MSPLEFLSELAAAEKLSGGQRSAALTKLAAAVNGDVSGSSDQAKVRMLSAAVKNLANAK